MGSLQHSAEYEVCDICGSQADAPLKRYAGDAVCDRCELVFDAAYALIDGQVTEEAEIVGTLGFVGYAFDPSEKAARNHRRLEVIKVVDGVPIVRLRDTVIEIETYDASSIARTARIDILSRHTDLTTLAELYRQELDKYGVHYDECAGGSVTWSTEDLVLTLTGLPPLERTH